MKTRRVIVLTALASFMVFSLFAYCTKESTTIAHLEGTTWKSTVANEFTLQVSFTTESAGTLSGLYGESVTFSYWTSESYGVLSYILPDNDWDDWIAFFPPHAELHLIDNNTLSVGGWVFTKQQ